jgi:hypothetical protein
MGWRNWLRDARLLLIIGILCGIGLGLVAGWQVWPVSYYDTDLSDLRSDYQDEYVVMVGALYALEQDRDAARQLLSELSEPSTAQSVEAIIVDVTERSIARGASPTEIGYLVGLAQALDSVTTPMQPYVNERQP